MQFCENCTKPPRDEVLYIFKNSSRILIFMLNRVRKLMEKNNLMLKYAVKQPLKMSSFKKVQIKLWREQKSVNELVDEFQELTGETKNISNLLGLWSISTKRIFVQTWCVSIYHTIQRAKRAIEWLLMVTPLKKMKFIKKNHIILVPSSCFLTKFNSAVAFGCLCLKVPFPSIYFIIRTFYRRKTGIRRKTFNTTVELLQHERSMMVAKHLFQSNTDNKIQSLLEKWN